MSGWNKYKKELQGVSLNMNCVQDKDNSICMILEQICTLRPATYFKFILPKTLPFRNGNEDFPKPKQCHTNSEDTLRQSLPWAYKSSKCISQLMKKIFVYECKRSQTP